MLQGIIELGVRSLRKFFFEHPMATYAAALAYRGLFGLFPFLLILVVLASALGFADFLERAMDQASAQSSQYVPQQLEPVIERGREQLQPLERMVEQAQKQASGELLFFGVAVALWSDLGGRSAPSPRHSMSPTRSPRPAAGGRCHCSLWPSVPSSLSW